MNKAEYLYWFLNRAQPGKFNNFRYGKPPIEWWVDTVVGEKGFYRIRYIEDLYIAAMEVLDES